MSIQRSKNFFVLLGVNRISWNLRLLPPLWSWRHRLLVSYRPELPKPCPFWWKIPVCLLSAQVIQRWIITNLKNSFTVRQKCFPMIRFQRLSAMMLVGFALFPSMKVYRFFWTALFKVFHSVPSRRQQQLCHRTDL